MYKFKEFQISNNYRGNKRKFFKQTLNSTNRVTLHDERWFKLANQKHLMRAVMQRPKV